jgi:hypothetical protein
MSLPAKVAAARRSASRALDAQKAALVMQQVRNNVSTKNDQPTVTVPPTEIITNPPVVTPAAPASQLVWGRWAAVADQAPTIDAAPLLAAGGQRWHTILITPLSARKARTWICLSKAR